MAVPAVVYAGAVARVKGVAAIRAAVGPPAIVAGIATFVAYAFVLAALERARPRRSPPFARRAS